MQDPIPLGLIRSRRNEDRGAAREGVRLCVVHCAPNVRHCANREYRDVHGGASHLGKLWESGRPGFSENVGCSSREPLGRLGCDPNTHPTHRRHELGVVVALGPVAAVGARGRGRRLDEGLGRPGDAVGRLVCRRAVSARVVDGARRGRVALPGEEIEVIPHGPEAKTVPHLVKYD